MDHAEELQKMYLRLLKQGIRGSLYQRDPESPFTEAELAQAEAIRKRIRERFGPIAQDFILRPAGKTLAPQADEVAWTVNNVTPQQIAQFIRSNSPTHCHSLVNDLGMRNVESCVKKVLADNIPGDLMECGVWRGGLVIYMRGLLKAYGDKTRKVWVADSFQGLPEPDEQISPIDALSHEALGNAFSVSLEGVKENFRRYGLLDDRVKFLPGWFNESLPTAPVQSLAVLRLDGDYYESTQPCLEHLYPKVSPGGFIIIDDYMIYTMGARRAVDEYRQAHGIQEPLMQANNQTVYWRKTA